MQLFLKIPRVAKAFEFMTIAHEGQMYGNLPYFVHPLAVAEAIPDPTEDELIAALLHDVIEDTPMDSDLIKASFGTSVYQMVMLLTKDTSLSYEENIMDIIASGNRSAIKVKWADNLVNMTGDKSFMTDLRRDKLNQRYSKSFEILSGILRM